MVFIMISLSKLLRKILVYDCRENPSGAITLCLKTTTRGIMINIITTIVTAITETINTGSRREKRRDPKISFNRFCFLMTGGGYITAIGLLSYKFSSGNPAQEASI
jgi:hypothetical protein